jgi:hypothetical protein
MPPPPPVAKKNKRPNSSNAVAIPYSVLTKKSKEPNQTETKILENFSLMLETEIKDLSQEFNKLSFTDKINELLNTLNSPNDVDDMCNFMETPVFNEYLTGIMTPDVIAELIDKYSETTHQVAQPSIDDIIKLTVANLRNGTMKKSLHEAKITHLSEQTFQKLKNDNDDVSPFDLNGKMINRLGGDIGSIIGVVGKGIGKAVHSYLIKPLLTFIFSVLNYILTYPRAILSDVGRMIDVPIDVAIITGEFLYKNLRNKDYNYNKDNKHLIYRAVKYTFDELNNLNSRLFNSLPPKLVSYIKEIIHSRGIILSQNGSASKKQKVTKSTNRKRNRGRTRRK